MNYLLDTNICIALIGGNKKVFQKLKQKKQSNFFISSISEAELWYGAFNSSDTNRNFKILGSFFPMFERLAFSSDEARWFGEIKTDLRKKGQLISDNDILIACHALAHDLVVVTDNTDEFKRITDLRVENWLR